jgi:hypothetical protein
MNNQKINEFVSTLFGDYVSMSLERFNERCKKLGKNGEDVYDWLYSHGMVRMLNVGHIEFVKYL